MTTSYSNCLYYYFVHRNFSFNIYKQLNFLCILSYQYNFVDHIDDLILINKHSIKRLLRFVTNFPENILLKLHIWKTFSLLVSDLILVTAAVFKIGLEFKLSLK